MGIAGRAGQNAKQLRWLSRAGLCAMTDGNRRGMATLAYEEVLVPQKASEEMQTVMFVHGILGAGKNLRTFARRLASSALEQSSPNSPGYRMILVDLRNHGISANLPGFGPPHDMPAAARDIAELIKASPWRSPTMIISHSLGGKVALEFGQNCATGQYGDIIAPKELWILDTVPGRVPDRESIGDVELVLSTVQDLPDPLPSRRWLVDHMTSAGFSRTLAEWLASNLKRTNGEEMTWIFNPKEAVEMFHSYRKLEYWSFLESPPKGMHIGIVRASKSDRWSSETISKLERLSEPSADKVGNVSYHVLEKAGHWLHVENPAGLCDILVPYLLKVSEK